MYFKGFCGLLVLSRLSEPEHTWLQSGLAPGSSLSRGDPTDHRRDADATLLSTGLEVHTAHGPLRCPLFYREW